MQRGGHCPLMRPHFADGPKPGVTNVDATLWRVRRCLELSQESLREAIAQLGLLPSTRANEDAHGELITAEATIAMLQRRIMENNAQATQTTSQEAR